MSSFPLVLGSYLSRGSFMTRFKEEGQEVGGLRVTFLFPQTPTAQDIQYSKVSYFGVTCPEPHHIQWGGLTSISPGDLESSQCAQCPRRTQGDVVTGTDWALVVTS